MQMLILHTFPDWAVEWRYRLDTALGKRQKTNEGPVLPVVASVADV